MHHQSEKSNSFKAAEIEDFIYAKQCAYACYVHDGKTHEAALTEVAKEVAAGGHIGQTRISSGLPYLTHCHEIMEALKRDMPQIIAGLSPRECQEARIMLAGDQGALNYAVSAAPLNAEEAEIFQNWILQYALMHDLFEKTNFTPEDLKRIGFHAVVADGLEAITKQEGELALDNTRRGTRENLLFRIVKPYDIANNMQDDVPRSEGKLESYPLSKDYIAAARREDFALGTSFIDFFLQTGYLSGKTEAEKQSIIHAMEYQSSEGADLPRAGLRPTRRDWNTSARKDDPPAAMLAYGLNS